MAGRWYGLSSTAPFQAMTRRLQAVDGGPNPASKWVGKTIYNWRPGWRLRTRGTITRYSVEAVQPNCPSDPGEFARPINRVDYDDSDLEELEESEVRILLCASELDTPTTSIVTRQTWDLFHHLRLMQSTGIDQSLGFDFSGNLAVCPCLRSKSCSLRSSFMTSTHGA